MKLSAEPLGSVRKGGPTVRLHQSFLDNLLEFISFVLDSGGKQIIAFVNLKTFLTENELAKLHEYVFYTGLSLLLLENKPDGTCYELERKRVIDQDFLEF